MKILLSKTNYQRKKDLLLQTNIVSDDGSLYVTKKALGDKAWENLIHSEGFYNDFRKRLPTKVKMAKFLKKDTLSKTVYYEFIKGETLRFRIEKALIERNYKEAEKLYKILGEVTDCFKSVSRRSELDGFNKFTLGYAGKIPAGVFKEVVPLTEFSHDHLIIDQNKIVTLIDFENFLEFPLPLRFIKFRAELYLLEALAQIIRSLGSKQFILKTYWKELFIPKDWERINNFSLGEKKFFLFVEEKLQDYLYNGPSHLVDLNLTDYQTTEIQERISKRVTVQSQNIIESLRDSRIHKLWRVYRKFRDSF